MIYHVKIRHCVVFLKHDKSWIIHYSIWKESSKPWLGQHGNPVSQATVVSGDTGSWALSTVILSGLGRGHSVRNGLKALVAQIRKQDFQS